MSYLSQNGTWSTGQAPMTSQAGSSMHHRISHQPEAQAWLNSSSSSHSSPFAAHSAEGTNSPMPSSSNINNAGYSMLNNPFDPNAFRMPAFSNAHDPSIAAPFAALLQQQQSMNGSGTVPGMGMSQQTWPNLQQFDASQAHLNTSTTLPLQGLPTIMQSGHEGSQPFTSINQSNTSLANYPMLLGTNNFTASPSSIGRNSPNANNPVSGVPFVPGASPALVNSMISRNTSQSNSLVGTPSDGSMHSSDLGLQGNHSMPSTSNDARIVKTKRSSVGGSTAGTHRRIKFRRSRTGCLVCRKRKVKCDQDGLPCKQCKFGKRDCHYEENPLPKRRRKSTVSNVQSNENSDAEKKRMSTTKGKAPSQSHDFKSSLEQQMVPQVALSQQTRKDDQSNVSQQAIFEKLRQAASQSSFMNLPDYGSNYGGDDESKETSEHWASTGSTFSAFHGGPDGEWNITTPSTGATSLHTVDGEMLGSNNSSRRVTLSDDRFEQFDFGSGTANLNNNQTNAGTIDIFAGFAANHSTTNNMDGEHAAGIQSVIKDRKTSLSPLHMDALHNRLSFDSSGLTNRINFQNQ